MATLQYRIGLPGPSPGNGKVALLFLLGGSSGWTVGLAAAFLVEAFALALAFAFGFGGGFSLITSRIASAICSTSFLRVLFAGSSLSSFFFNFGQRFFLRRLWGLLFFPNFDKIFCCSFWGADLETHDLWRSLLCRRALLWFLELGSYIVFCCKKPVVDYGSRIGSSDPKQPRQETIEIYNGFGYMISHR